jgi:uncharacterized YigZ family protein
MFLRLCSRAPFIIILFIESIFDKFAIVQIVSLDKHVTKINFVFKKLYSMNFPQIIKNITNISEYKFKEKGSLFIGTAIPVFSEEEATAKLNELRKKYYDATHNCYAYFLTGEKLKYSDDGEPNGTAGIRILNAIKHFELNDLIVVVTRYFGGTKLGVGPLGKAYYDCSMQTLSASIIVSKKLHEKIIISYPFEFSNLVHRMISKYSAKIEETKFEPTPTMQIIVPEESVKILCKEIQSASNQKIQIEETDGRIYI